MCGWPYHDLSGHTNDEPEHTRPLWLTDPARARCRRKREWHGAAIPEAEWCADAETVTGHLILQQAIGMY